MDLVRLGPFEMKGQAFGQVTSVPQSFFDDSCGVMDGVLGLGKPMGGVPSIMEGIALRTDPPVVSFYFNSEVDDYSRRRHLKVVDLDVALQMMEGDDADALEGTKKQVDDQEFAGTNPKDEVEDLAQEFVDDDQLMQELDGGDQNRFPNQRPTSANSELILGGVNRRRYQGCLVWHDVVNLDDQTNDIYWSIAFRNLLIGDYNALAPIAVLDSSSVFLLGPVEPIAVFLMSVPAVCSVLDEEGDRFLFRKVPCDAPLNDKLQGYDLVQIPCNIDVDALKTMRFQSDEAEYTIGVKELIRYEREQDTDLCPLNILPSTSLDYFVFGTPFMKKYYTAIHIQDMKIGFAPALSVLSQQQSQYLCQDDAYFDVSQLPQMQQDLQQYYTHPSNTVQFASAALPNDAYDYRSVLFSKNFFASLTFLTVAFLATIAFFVRRRRNRNAPIETPGEHRHGVLQELPGMQTIEMEDWKAYDYDYDEEENFKL